jgi:hypothetical protein
VAAAVLAVKVDLAAAVTPAQASAVLAVAAVAVAQPDQAAPAL